MHAFTTIDRRVIEVWRARDRTWIAEVRGGRRRVMPIHEFVEDRAQAAARIRDEALVSSLAAAARWFARAIARNARATPAVPWSRPPDSRIEREGASDRSLALVDTEPRRSP